MGMIPVLVAASMLISAAAVHASYADSTTIYEQYTFQDTAVIGMVDMAISTYDAHGTAAWGMITPLFDIHTNDLYVFVVNGTTWETVAHGAIPDRLGHVPYSILNTGDKSIHAITHELETDGHSWVEYVFTNPGTDTIQYKRTYLAYHDGFIFGSGYYLPDARVQSVIDNIISGFEQYGIESFNHTLGQDRHTHEATFGVVLNRTDVSLVAIGTTGVWLDTMHGLPVEADRPMIRAWHDVLRDGRAWLERVTFNTATNTEQMMRQLWHAHGDYVYVSGYYIPDSRAQSAVDQALAAYHLHGTGAFDILTPDCHQNMRDGFSFILDKYGTIVSHGNDHTMAGRTMPVDASSGWHQTGHTRTWLYHHDGYVFGSSYDIRDSMVEAMVRNMVHLDNAGRNVTDMILQEYTEGDAIPFILSLDGTYLAHPDPYHTGVQSGMVLPYDGAGIWHADRTWLYRVGDVVFGASAPGQ